MASKPRRRRNNKHNSSYVKGMDKNNMPVFIPRSRKAFKEIMRNDRLAFSKDFGVLKQKTKGLKIGEVIYIKALEDGVEILDNKELAGYYSVNAKGQPVRLTNDQLATYKKIREAEKAERQSFQKGA